MPLVPSRLFYKSPRGTLLERNFRGKRTLEVHHHKYIIYGDSDCGNNLLLTRPLLEGGGPDQNYQNGTILKMNRWYYHADSVLNIADGYIRDLIHQGFPDGWKLWTGVCDNAIHRSQRLEAKPLKSSDWPRDPLGPSWPSFPSIPEWMEMLRKGIDPCQRGWYCQPGGNLGFTQVSRSELSRNAKLATLIVRNAIVGIRSSIEVPRKFLKYFRYRSNFLILTCFWSLPIGLVRFLLAQWYQNPYSLWLRRAVCLKTFLRKVPIQLVRRAEPASVVYAEIDLRHTLARGLSHTPDELSSEYDSEGSSQLD